LFISLKLPFAIFSGTLIKPETNILLVCEPGKEVESITRLARVGYENVIGYLDGGFDTWTNAGKEVTVVDKISADKLKEEINQGKFINSDKHKNKNIV